MTKGFQAIQSDRNWWKQRPIGQPTTFCGGAFSSTTGPAEPRILATPVQPQPRSYISTTFPLSTPSQPLQSISTQHPSRSVTFNNSPTQHPTPTSASDTTTNRHPSWKHHTTSPRISSLREPRETYVHSQRPQRTVQQTSTDSKSTLSVDGSHCKRLKRGHQAIEPQSQDDPSSKLSPRAYELRQGCSTYTQSSRNSVSAPSTRRTTTTSPEIMTSHQQQQQQQQQQQPAPVNPYASRCSLYIRQQPRAARAGPDGKDRRVVDPPPILQLMISGFDPESPEDVAEMHAQFVVHCKLVSADSPRQEMSTVTSFGEDGSREIQRLLLGTYVSSPLHTNDDPDPSSMPQHPTLATQAQRPPSPTSRFLPSVHSPRRLEPHGSRIPGAFFIFADISVRKAGEYRLEFSLMRMDPFYLMAGRPLPILHTVTSDAFRVVNAKDFDQVQASTALVKGLLQRGAGFPLKLKKGTREGGRRRTTSAEHSENDDDDEDTMDEDDGG